MPQVLNTSLKTIDRAGLKPGATTSKTSISKLRFRLRSVMLWFIVHCKRQSLANTGIHWQNVRRMRALGSGDRNLVRCSVESLIDE